MKNQLFKVSLLALLVSVTSACNSDGDNDSAVAPEADDNSATYTVHFTNLTYNQPLAPAAIILHEPGYHAFVDGESASVALEELAEGGSPDMLLSEASTSASYLDSISTGAPTGPRGTSETSTLVIPDVEDLRLSFASMLVNTNDAFTALNSVDVSNMAVGQSTSFMTPTWDSGTEENLETASTMPGPAATDAGGGGEAAGFDAARDDLFDLVHFHGGVVTNANATDASLEGLSTSVLNESHRWNNPTAKVTITRTR